jgi:hypothetical protein
MQRQRNHGGVVILDRARIPVVRSIESAVGIRFISRCPVVEKVRVLY